LERRARRAAIEVYVGPDVGPKRVGIRVVEASGVMLWRVSADTHPGMVAATLSFGRDSIVKRGIETGSTTPWLARGLTARGLTAVVMEAGREADRRNESHSLRFGIRRGFATATSA
jgi:transposase